MASRAYAIEGVAASGTNVTILQLIAATTTRGWIYDIIVGSSSTPADVAIQLNVIRGTVQGTAPTGTPGTPVGRALDPANPAALLVAQCGATSAPTKTSLSAMLDIAVNQRATFRWVAAPGSEFVVPATANNWVGIESILASSGTPNINATIMWLE